METLSYAQIPTPLPDGFAPTILAKGHSIVGNPNNWEVSNAAAVLSIFNAYSGGTDQLAWSKSNNFGTGKQDKLDALFNANFDLAKFIRGGTATTITAANIGTFLATITNNYRSLRSQIANATTVAAVNAININSGWPSNP